MKLLTLTLAATLLTIIATPKSAHADNLDGHWTLAARECSSGTPPRDRFYLNKDYLKLVFERGGVLIPMSVQNGEEILIASARVRVNGARVAITIQDIVTEQGVLTPDKGQVSAEAIEGLASADGQLFQIVTSGFGKNGTCPDGDILTHTFKRENRY